MEQQICDEYMKTIDDFGFLTREEESELAKKVVAGDTEARNRFVCHNIALVINVASKMNIDNLEDRVQEGLIGLMQAIDKFDPSLGYRLSTYAYRWIRKTIMRAFDTGGSTIRLPTHLREFQHKIYKVVERYRNVHNSDPSYEEIERQMDGELSAEKIEKVWEQHKAIRGIASLDKPAGDDVTIGDFVNGVDWTFDDNPEYVQSMLSCLKPRHAAIVSLRYGLKDGVQRTKMDIARLLGISGQRVGQLLEYSIEKMKSYLCDSGDAYYSTAS